MIPSYPAERPRVIHVSGSDRDIGAQHAEQVGAVVADGMVSVYFRLWERMLRQGTPRPLFQPFLWTAKRLVDPILTSALARATPPQFRERLKGLAAASGVPYRRLETALILPDLLPLLQSWLTIAKPESFVPVQFPEGLLGCSSFMSRGRHFFYGRNLDFPGVAYWDRYPVLQVTRGRGALRMIGFTSAGVPLCGITGINEAQITVALHQHYARPSGLTGHLPFVVGEEVLAQATTLESALEILRSRRVNSAWAFLVTDGKTRRGFLYETHPRASGVKWLGDDGGTVLSHTNYLQTEACQRQEFAATARMNWDNYARKRRLEKLVRDAGYDMNAATAVQALSDHFDPYWGEEKVLNRTISQVYNIQSVLFDPENMTAHFAVGDAPIHLRTYQKYDLGEMFAGRSGETVESLPAFRFQKENQKEAKERYILSFIAAFDGKFQLAAEEIERSLACDPCPEAGIVAGVVRLKLGDTRAGKEHLARAKEHVEEAMQRLGKTLPPPEYFEGALHLARAHDLLGERAEAERLYRWLASHPHLEDAHIRDIAREARPYTKDRLANIFMPYSSYIPLD